MRSPTVATPPRQRRAARGRGRDWGGARVATVSGRYYAMDRDKRWDRTELAFDAIVKGEAEFRRRPGRRRSRQAYERGETDEFIKPTVVGEEGRDPRRRPCDLLQLPARPRPPADREARARRAFRSRRSPSTTRTGTTRSRSRRRARTSRSRRRSPTAASAQLHVAETEKYAHVTYFFNGGEEDEYPREERALVDSPRDVPTYDKKPEMSAREAAERVRGALARRATSPSGSSTSRTRTWSATPG